MRRITPLAALAVPLVLVGCADEDAGPLATPATVAVGGLPGSLPTTRTSQPESVPPSSAPSSAAASSPVTPAELAATSFAAELGELQVEVPPSRTVTDDTGRLRIDVPEAWEEQRAAPAAGVEGTEMPSLSAAPDMTAFLDGYDTPGLTALVVDDRPDDALDTYDFREDCDAAGRAPFRGGATDGAYDVWRDCGGTGSDIVTVAVRPDDADQTVLVLAQLVEPGDAAALDHALATLTLRD